MPKANEKAHLRERFRRERKVSFIPESFSHVLSAPEFTDAKIVASYLSYGEEPSTQEINSELLKRGVTVLLPRVEGDQMKWISWDGKLESLKARGKILEPTGTPYESVSEIEIIIVPALHIDRDGYRLGQGGGHYDRALSHFSGWKLGLAYAGEISSESLPRQDHDVALNAAATPNLIVRFSK